MGKSRVTFKEYHTESSGIFFEVDRILSHFKSEYQDILLFESEFWGKVFVLDGLVMTTEKDAFFYHESLAHPPMVFSEGVDEVLIIGGGDGGVLCEVLKYQINRVFLVDIDAGVIKLAKDFFNMEEIFADERVFVRVEDGFKVVKEGKRYDVILVDSTDPVGPAKVLFEREFFDGLRNSLKEGGFISVQVGNPLFYSNQIYETYKIAKEIFPTVKIYSSFTPTYPGGFWTFFLLGFEEPKKRRDLPKGNRFLVSERILNSILGFEDFVKTFCKIA
jgi:Spermidine synthase